MIGVDMLSVELRKDVEVQDYDISHEYGDQDASFSVQCRQVG